MDRRRRRLFLSSGPSYSDEALALFARMTVPPTDARKTAYDTFIRACKTAGVWTKFDAVYLTAAATQQQARLCLNNATYNLVDQTGTVTFTADRGFQGDGSTDLSTGFNPNVAPSPKLTLNNAHMGLWSLTNLAFGAQNSVDMGNSNNFLRRDVAVAGRAGGRIGSATGLIVGTSAYPGHICIARSASNLWEGYAQGVDSGGGTDATTSLSGALIRLCTGGAGGGGTNQIAAAHFGSNLTAQEVAALKAALQAYLVTVGAV